MRCNELQTYSPTQPNRLLTMHSITINTALSSVSRLHGYYIGDYVMPIELLLR